MTEKQKPETSPDAVVKDHGVLYIGMDLGTSRTAISSSNGVRESMFSVVGYPKDHVARKLLQKEVLVGKEALDKRLSLEFHRPLAQGVLRNGDPRRPMRLVLSILRAADALDGRQHDPPHVRMKLRDDKLKLRCHLFTDCRRARKFFSRRKKFRLLEELMQVKVDIGVREAAAVVAR